MSEERIPKRSEVAKENTWALEDIFPTDEAWEKALEDFKKLPETIASYKGRLGESADTLLAQGKEIEHNTGYDELGMLSLSTSDYTELAKLTDGLLCAFDGRHTSLSLPSLRIDNFALATDGSFRFRP